MYNVPAYASGVRLLNRAGQCTRYPSLRAAFKELGYWWIRSHVGVAFSDPDALGLYPGVSWIMRTDEGEPLTAADFEHLFVEQQERIWARRKKQHVFRRGPVPGTRKARRGRFLRHMRHMNARRAAALVLPEEGEVPFRAKRSLRALPDPWDDYPISSLEDRNWKRFRRTQWK